MAVTDQTLSPLRASAIDELTVVQASSRISSFNVAVAANARV